jgi:anti-sigma factor (TIGR02949 family)
MSGRLDRASCEEAFRRLEDYLDRRLSPSEMQLVEAHLRVCAACTREFNFEAGLLRGLRRKLRRVAAPPGLLASIEGEIARAQARMDEGE